MRASVIIVTRDRRDDLQRALESIAEERALEVLVVDDGSTDGTWEMLAARDDVTPIRLKESRGPGRARNEAARRAQGEFLVFLDSDCRARPGWLDALLDPFARPGVGAVGGAEALDPDAGFGDRLVHFLLTSKWTTGGVRGSRGARAGRYRPRSYSMAVRRELFRRVGGFAGLRHGEDIDLSVRLARLGAELVHAPDSRVYHRRRATAGGFVRQLFAMGRARATLIRRDPIHAEPAFLLPALATVLGPALIALALFWPPARIALAAVAAYLVLVGVAAAVALESAAALPVAPAAFVAQHAAYGAGFLFGLAFRFSEEPA